MTRAHVQKPDIGAHAVLDEGLHFNALSGRKAASTRVLTVGSHARIRSGTVLYAGTRIGNHFETGHHVVVREENRIGHRVAIWNNSTIDYGCTLGDRVKIHCNCYIAQYSILEDDVFLAPGVIFANDLFPGSAHAERALQGPKIGHGAKIGVNCTILPGVKIGARALIGAGSVVTHDIEPGTVAWGNPARVHKRRRDLSWPEDYFLYRPKENKFYRQKLAGRPVFFN